MVLKLALRGQLGRLFVAIISVIYMAGCGSEQAPSFEEQRSYLNLTFEVDGADATAGIDVPPEDVVTPSESELEDIFSDASLGEELAGGGSPDGQTDSSGGVSDGADSTAGSTGDDASPSATQTPQTRTAQGRVVVMRSSEMCRMLRSWPARKSLAPQYPPLG